MASGKGESGESGVGMALVKVSGRARSKAGHDTGFGHGREILNGLAFLTIYHASVP